jgi:hypothetical protein
MLILDFQYEIPKGKILIEDYALGMKFQISDLPIDCILALLSFLQ